MNSPCQTFAAQVIAVWMWPVRATTCGYLFRTSRTPIERQCSVPVVVNIGGTWLTTKTGRLPSFSATAFATAFPKAAGSGSFWKTFTNR